MSESCKCPKCPELLNRDNVLHHLCTVERMPMREAVRWAARYVDVRLAGEGDGCGQSHSGYTQKEDCVKNG